MQMNDVSTERLVSDLRRVVHDSEEILKATGEEVEVSHDMRERLAQTLESAKAVYRKIQTKTVAAAKATDQTIRTHPYQALGVALGAGLIVGLLIGRRKAA